MNKITIKYLKWTSTFLTLFGILAFYLDYYPYSMIPHGLIPDSPIAVSHIIAAVFFVIAFSKPL